MCFKIKSNISTKGIHVCTIKGIVNGLKHFPLNYDVREYPIYYKKIKLLFLLNLKSIESILAHLEYSKWSCAIPYTVMIKMGNTDINNIFWCFVSYKFVAHCADVESYVA